MAEELAEALEGVQDGESYSALVTRATTILNKHNERCQKSENPRERGGRNAIHRFCFFGTGCWLLAAGCAECWLLGFTLEGAEERSIPRWERT